MHMVRAIEGGEVVERYRGSLSIIVVKREAKPAVHVFNNRGFEWKVRTKLNQVKVNQSSRQSTNQTEC